jgi:hypothetical protein
VENLGLPEQSSENLRDGAAMSEVLSLVSTEEEEKAPEEDSSDKNSGLHIECSVYDGCKDRCPDLRQEAEAEVAATRCWGMIKEFGSSDRHKLQSMAIIETGCEKIST